MKFKLGDFVRFVDEKMEGYVTRIINEDMVGVTGEDDFEIPVMASKITFVQGRNFNDQDVQQTKETRIAPEAFKLKGIYLAIVPDKHKNSVVHFHLVNQTSFQLPITVQTEKSAKLKGEFIGIIPPASAVKVYAASLNEMELWPKFNFQLIYYSSQDIKTPDPLVISEKFKAKDFSGNKTQIPFLEQPGWMIRLDQEDLIIDAEKLKESFFKSSEEKKEIERPPAREVDLHIEKLREDHQFLNKADILKFQLEAFNKSLDAAIVHRLPSIVFIHGVGNGTLRHEIHKTLGKHHQVKTFMDARKEKFGYGATEVILK